MSIRLCVLCAQHPAHLFCENCQQLLKSLPALLRTEQGREYILGLVYEAEALAELERPAFPPTTKGASHATS